MTFGWHVVLLLAGLGSPTVIEVYRNGESEAVGHVSGACASRSALEAAVSRLGCGDPAACEVRDGAGRVVVSCEALSQCAAEGLQPPGLPRAYAVPRDKRFVFATDGVGFERRLPHVRNATLVTLAEAPRLFEIRGFIEEAEADALVADALAIDDDEHKLMRSSTGPKGYNPSSVRTSENAWVKHTSTAMQLKRRAFTLLGYPRLDEGTADGLQVLRYNRSKAYVAHTDYLSQPVGVSGAQMNPALGGANRLATIFLYLSDVEEGGQTVFPNVEAPDDRVEALQPPDSLTDAVARLRDDHAPDGWQHRMVHDCYSKLAVRPKKARAILYYSQRPDGSLDPDSRHGGCPVLQGQKWAANLWVWNKLMPFGSSRFGDDDNKAVDAKPPPDSIAATFRYRGRRTDVSLFWNTATKMGDFQPPTNTIRLNTFADHSFTAATAAGRLLASFRVTPTLAGLVTFAFDDDGQLDLDEEDDDA